MQEFKNIQSFLGNIDWSDSFWVALIRYFRSMEMPESLIGHTFLIIPALISEALGYPLFVWIKSFDPAKLSKFLHCCLGIVPEEWIIDSTRAPKLDALESLRGKIVVARNNGVPVRIVDNIFDAYLNQDPPTGYVGVLSSNDPRRNSADTLAVDLDTDMSELTRKIEGDIDQGPRWETEIQKAFLKTSLKGLKERPGFFDLSFLKKKWSSGENPHKDIVLRVYPLIARLGPEFIRFDTKGALIDPLPHSHKTTLITEAMTYTLAPLILEKSLNRRPLIADYSPGEIHTLNTLKTLQENDSKASGFTVEKIIEGTGIAQSTQYRLINALEEKGAIKVAYGEKYCRLYSANSGVFEVFSDLSYPTWEEYQQEMLPPEPEATPSDTESPLTNEAESERDDLSPLSLEAPADSQQPMEGEPSDEALKEKNDNLDVNDPGSSAGDIGENVSGVPGLHPKKKQGLKEPDLPQPKRGPGRPRKNQQEETSSEVERQATTNPESNVTPPEVKTSEDTEKVTSPTPLAEETTPAAPVSDENKEDIDTGDTLALSTTIKQTGR
jgi:hypothetical protein